ncbi:hypothetical protein ES708_22742 [subsurface metagenome]
MAVVFATEKEIEEEEEKERLLTIGNKEYFSVKDIMKWLPGSATTMKKYIRTGRIRGKKISGKWFVSREDLYIFLGGK